MVTALPLPASPTSGDFKFRTFLEVLSPHREGLWMRPRNLHFWQVILVSLENILCL